MQGFIAATGYTFPVLRQAGFLQDMPPSGYDIAYDNYVVLDAQGIVRYTSQAYPRAPATGRFFDTELRAAIQAALPLAIEGRTWSGVKGLYR